MKAKVIEILQKVRQDQSVPQKTRRRAAIWIARLI